MAFDVVPSSVVIPPASLHSVTISGRALETGTASIRGCTVKLAGTQAREFLLPHYTKAEQELRDRNDPTKTLTERCKRVGLAAYLSQQADVSVLAPTEPPAYLECAIAPAQPLLRIVNTTLVHGAMMLYEGEE